MVGVTEEVAANADVQYKPGAEESIDDLYRSFLCGGRREAGAERTHGIGEQDPKSNIFLLPGFGASHSLTAYLGAVRTTYLNSSELPV